MRSQIIQYAQLLICEPPRHQNNAQRDEGNDQNGEADRGNSLRDGDGSGDTENLKTDVESDLTAGNVVESVVGLNEAPLRLKVDELLDDAIRFDGAPLMNTSAIIDKIQRDTYTNNEKHSCKDCSWHRVQHHQKRPRHRSPDRHAHQEV